MKDVSWVKNILKELNAIFLHITASHKTCVGEKHFVKDTFFWGRQGALRRCIATGWGCALKTRVISPPERLVNIYVTVFLDYVVEGKDTNNSMCCEAWSPGSCEERRREHVNNILLALFHSRPCCHHHAQYIANVHTMNEPQSALQGCSTCSKSPTHSPGHHLFQYIQVSCMKIRFLGTFRKSIILLNIDNFWTVWQIKKRRFSCLFLWNTMSTFGEIPRFCFQIKHSAFKTDVSDLKLPCRQCS